MQKQAHRLAPGMPVKITFNSLAHGKFNVEKVVGQLVRVEYFGWFSLETGGEVDPIPHLDPLQISDWTDKDERKLTQNRNLRPRKGLSFGEMMSRYRSLSV